MATPTRIPVQGSLCGDVTARGIVTRCRQLGNLRPHLVRLPLRRSWPPLARAALRHLPRRQFGLLPALERAVLVDDRAELHARLAQRPHRRVCRAAHPPLCARPAAQGTDANVVGDPQPVMTAQITDANAVGDSQPVPNTLCARIAATAINFELQCKPKDGSE